jgi:hypothetical protein
MADDDTKAKGADFRDVPVDWEALEDAFENNAPEVHSYLQLVTGEVLRVVDGIADPEMHSRISAEPIYMRVEPVSSREQYRWMERFIQMVDDRELRASLAHAIDGKGAFRRFKDALMTNGPARERWFVFRSERLRVFMEAWLSAHALQPIARPAAPVAAAVATAPEAVVTDATEARRARSADSVRGQLREVCEGLGTRDLEKVLVFAEFVKMRRAGRGYAAGGDAPASGVEEAPPSSHKVSTIR